MRGGVRPSDAYSVTILLMAALLVVGFFCNRAVGRAPRAVEV